MILSMTGYGRGVSTSGDLLVLAEVRSFNSRFLDISLRLPKALGGLDQRVRDLVRQYVVRGHVNLTVRVKNGDERTIPLQADLMLARSYVRALHELKKELRLPGRIEIGHLLQFPEILSGGEESEDAEALWEPVQEAVTTALQELQEMRAKEGQALEKDLRGRIARLEQLVQRIEEEAQRRRGEQFERMRERVRQLLADDQIDENRLYTELAILVDRMDVTEECVRFRSHNAQFLRAMEAEEAVGRRLNFLLQEMHREATTIGAKAYSAEISHLVVELKEEIERIREQVQNIE
ncbi:MAG: YicC family protein [candidate division KSB1 bacterium]|nr:YicC family protein [candidate division KSB1 bacterium]